MDILLLFAVSLLAATIFPAQSEAVLAGLHLTGAYSAVLLVLVATTGNVLGSCVNYGLGRYLAHFKDRKWFPVKEAQMERAMRTYQRFGVWTLLLAWVPLIGDPLTVIAGMLKANLLLFITLVTIGKAGRYIAIVVAL
ncbi:MAG: DedA family protein [Desulfamplus sp.]|nr:DedA family protein [Desulfamplus sp.]